LIRYDFIKLFFILTQNIKIQNSIEMKNDNQTMGQSMIPDNAHKDIPGNPSTAKSSLQKLNDPRNWEQTKYETAKLNELGEKLLGLKNW